MAADMDIPIACISRCTPMARTGWRTRGPARTCRGICCGTARPWRTTRRGSIGHRRSRETPCARRSTHRANGPGCAGATAKSRARSYPDRRTSWTPSSSEVVGSTPSSYRGIAPGRGTRDGGGGRGQRATWRTNSFRGWSGSCRTAPDRSCSSTRRARARSKHSSHSTASCCGRRAPEDRKTGSGKRSTWCEDGVAMSASSPSSNRWVTRRRCRLSACRGA